MGKLSLNTAEGTRIELTREQQKEIEGLYRRVANDIAKRSEKIPSTNSEALRQQYLKKLQTQVNEQLEKIGQEIEGTITQTMTQVAADVVSDNLKWMESVGMPVGGAFSHVPDDVVRSVATGQLYKGNWSLSKAIWGNTQKTQNDINTVIAEGIAQNKSAYDIAKDLEKYVNPSAKKDWSWSKVYPGTNKKVDYNAQRLARTLVSHAYQQAFVKTTQKNPFVTKYKWLGSNSHRICPICAARDGKLFEKDELPLDHPNGMCTFVAVMDSMVDIADRLADWAQGKEDPALDAYARYIYGDGFGSNTSPIKSETLFNRVSSRWNDIIPGIGNKIGVKTYSMGSEYFQGLLSGSMAYIDPNNPSTLYLNPDFFSDENLHKISGQILMKLHPNANPESIIAHELAHSFSLGIDEHGVVSKAVSNFLNEDGYVLAAKAEAERMGYPYLPGDENMLKFLDGYQVAGKTVSYYASTTEHEFFAECMADFYVNGDKASTISKELVNLVREELK